jgi:hypothetical protein
MAAATADNKDKSSVDVAFDEHNKKMNAMVWTPAELDVAAHTNMTMNFLPFNTVHDKIW